MKDVLRQEEAANGIGLDMDANDTIDNVKPSSVQQEGVADTGMEDGEGEGLALDGSATEQVKVLRVNQSWGRRKLTALGPFSPQHL